MSGPAATVDGDLLTPLQDDLVAMLRATREAERDLFGAFDADARTAPLDPDGWSAKDVLGHLAAWRGVEARRLLASAGLEPVPPDDPLAGDPIDEANERLRAARADRDWDVVDAEAAASIDALVAAVTRSSNELLCECDRLSAGIGANGINHAIGHLSDVARGTGREARYRAFAAEVERILAHNHLLPHDSGVMLYNIACHDALAGRLDDARRRLRTAFGRRGDLLEAARSDPDLVALRPELDTLAAR